MDFLFTGYRDPIFGLIILITAVLLIIVLSYFWGILLSKNKQKIIDKFLQKFERESDDTSAIFNALSTLKSHDLIKVGDALAKNGDWDNAVLMYLQALKKEANLRENLLKKLGLAYIKTGFFERAKDAYMQLLATSPRDEQALKDLIFIQEKLRDFKACFECCDVLYAQGIDVSELRAYLQGLQITYESISLAQKIELLSQIKPRTPFIKRLILELKITGFLGVNEEDLPPLEICIDLLDEKTLFLIQNDKSQNAFLIELLKLAKGQNISAKLAFDYECKNCALSYPVFFNRCPNCMQANSVMIKAKIIQGKKANE